MPDGQELAGEGGGASAGALDGLDLGHEGVDAVEPAQHDLAAAEDDGEQVVEVVRHAPRQPGHGAEPLRLLELLQHALALGDVLHDGQDPGHHPLVVLEGGGRHRQRQGHVVDVEPGQLHTDRGLAVARPFPQAGEHGGGIVVSGGDALVALGRVVPAEQRAGGASSTSGPRRSRSSSAMASGEDSTTACRRCSFPWTAW